MHRSPPESFNDQVICRRCSLDNLGVVLQQKPCMVDFAERMIWNGDCLPLCVLFLLVNAVFFPHVGSFVLLLFGFFTFYSCNE